MNKVDNLKKVKVSIKAGTSQDTMDLTPKHPQIEFIFGLGPGGMTPFEYYLVDRTEGDSISLYLKKDDFDSFFEHLHPPLMDLFDGRDDVYLKVNIDTAIPAGSREVVKAMAEMAAHGGVGCDCGCGCGG